MSVEEDSPILVKNDSEITVLICCMKKGLQIFITSTENIGSIYSP